MKRLICLALSMVSSIVLGQAHFKLTPLEWAPEGFGDVFSRAVDVFGIPIYATEKTPVKKVLHAASVLAQYLDNDSDGKPDNDRVHKALVDDHGAVAMFATEREPERLDLQDSIPEKVWESMKLVALYGEETHPNGASQHRFDATLEEVLHLITSVGYANAYPEIFGEKKGTEIAIAMDKARGGSFTKIPKTYPEGAWYTYEDRTCDYGCQITEYIYWGLTSILGAQHYPGRLEEISNEWKLNTSEKVQQGDPMLYGLLTDPQYVFPVKLPDGKYSPLQRKDNQ